MRNIIRKFLNQLYLLGPGRDHTEAYLNDWENSIRDPRKYYLMAYRYFNLFINDSIKEHRVYFQQEKRGFGEAAFHAMWYFIYKKYQFTSFLEIGVYRGQVMSLIALLGKLSKQSISISGISPFDKSGDAVSKYIDIDYMQDIYTNFDYFKLSKPNLTNAYSTDPVAKEVIESKLWDCIYIDGSHDYDIVLKDWKLCSENVKIGGIIVVDDASLYTDFKPPFFSFKGHPGPSQVADEVDKGEFTEILRVGHNRVFQKNT